MKCIGTISLLIFCSFVSCLVVERTDPLNILQALNTIPLEISLSDVSLFISVEGTFYTLYLHCTPELIDKLGPKKSAACLPNATFTEDSGLTIVTYLNGKKLPAVPLQFCLPLERTPPLTTCSDGNSTTISVRQNARERWCAKRAAEKFFEITKYLAEYLPPSPADIDLEDHVESNLKYLPQNDRVKLLLEERRNLPTKKDSDWCWQKLKSNGWRKAEEEILSTTPLVRLDPDDIIYGVNGLVAAVVKDSIVLAAGFSKWVQPGMVDPGLEEDDLHVGTALEMVQQIHQNAAEIVFLEWLWILLSNGIKTVKEYRNQPHLDLAAILPLFVAEAFSTFTASDFVNEVYKSTAASEEEVHFAKLHTEAEWVPYEITADDDDTAGTDSWCTIQIGSTESEWTVVHAPISAPECILYRITSVGNNKVDKAEKSVGIVTMTTLDDFAFFVKSLLNHFCFAMKTSQQYYIAIAKKSLLEGQRSGYALKFQVMLEALNRHEYVLWLDRDAWFNMPQVFEEDLDVRKYFKNDSISVVLTSDGFTFNTGVFILRNATFSRSLMSISYSESSDGYFYSHPGDQAAISHVILKMLNESKDIHFDYNNECKCKGDPCYGYSYSKLICFQHISARNNITNWIHTDLPNFAVVGGWASELNNTGVGCHAFEDLHCLHDVYKPAHIIHSGSDGPGGRYRDRTKEIEYCEDYLFGIAKLPSKPTTTSNTTTTTAKKLVSATKPPFSCNYSVPILEDFLSGSHQSVPSLQCIFTHAVVDSWVFVHGISCPFEITSEFVFYLFLNRQLLFEGHPLVFANKSHCEIRIPVFPQHRGNILSTLVVVSHQDHRVLSRSSHSYNLPNLDALSESTLSDLLSIVSPNDYRWLGRLIAHNLHKSTSFLCNDVSSESLCVPPIVIDAIYNNIKLKHSYDNYVDFSLCANRHSVPLHHLQKIFHYPVYHAQCAPASRRDSESIVCGVYISDSDSIESGLHAMLVLHARFECSAHYFYAVDDNKTSSLPHIDLGDVPSNFTSFATHLLGLGNDVVAVQAEYSYGIAEESVDHRNNIWINDGRGNAVAAILNLNNIGAVHHSIASEPMESVSFVKADWREESTADFRRFLCRIDGRNAAKFPTALLPPIKMSENLPKAFWMVSDVKIDNIALWLNTVISLMNFGHRLFLPIALDAESHKMLCQVGLCETVLYPEVPSDKSCDHAVYGRVVAMRKIVKEKMSFLLTNAGAYYLRDPTARLKDKSVDWMMHIDVDYHQAPFPYKWQYFRENSTITACLDNTMFGMNYNQAGEDLIEDWYNDALLPSVCNPDGYFITSFNSFMYHRGIEIDVDNDAGMDSGLEYDGRVPNSDIKIKLYSQQSTSSTYEASTYFVMQDEATIKQAGLWFVNDSWREIAISREWSSFSEYIEAIKRQEALKYIRVLVSVFDQTVLAVESENEMILQLKYALSPGIDISGKLVIEAYVNGIAQDQEDRVETTGQLAVSIPHDYSKVHVVLLNGTDNSVIAASDIFQICAPLGTCG